MRIIIASDSFKGSLTSQEVGEAAADGIRQILPDAEIIILPVGDGGEGTAVALADALNADWINCEVSDPLGRKILAAYGIATKNGETSALIDMASASGVALLNESERDVMNTSSFGTGQLILDAARRGCRNFVIGIGGSATNDAGIGMLSALGICFYNQNELILNPSGKSLNYITRIDASALNPDIKDSHFTIICDVNNPLFGPEGAACIFAPQKGASPEEVMILDNGLCNFAKTTEEFVGINYSQTPGAGAAGGLGFAFISFLNSELKSGTDTILDLIGFDKIIDGADLVITGEGKIDAQTLYGKLPSGVARRASAKGVPTIAIAGRTEDESLLLRSDLFRSILCVTPTGMPLSEAMRHSTARTNIATALAAFVNAAVF